MNETIKAEAGFTCPQLIVAHMCHKLFVTLTNRVTPCDNSFPLPLQLVHYIIDENRCKFVQISLIRNINWRFN